MATSVVAFHYRETGSTQADAARLAAGRSTPVLVMTDRQTHGRGRLGRAWEPAPRALACSVALRPRMPTESWGTIPLVAGLAAREAVHSVAGVLAGLKWPNDLVTESGKVGGVLVEASGQLVVVGVGVNLWWPSPPDGASAVYDDDPGGAVIGGLARAFADRLIDAVDDGGSWDRDAYVAACVTLGEEITWQSDGRGIAIDVDADGGLVVESGGTRLTLRSGDVHTVRPATLSKRPRPT